MTFEIEDLGELVKLTVLHGNFEPGSTVAAMASQGWPRVLSELKTLARDRRAAAKHQLIVRTTTTVAGARAEAA